jgi:hypothetical protein
LYPLQAELESKLQGAPAERREYAALFPMRVLLDTPAPSALAQNTTGAYLYNAVKYIDSKAPGQLVLIKRLLSLDSQHISLPSDGAMVTRKYLARLYIKHHTAQMKPADKAQFVADMLRPSNKFAGWDGIADELLYMGDESGTALLNMLQDEETRATDLKTPGACECVDLVQGMLFVRREVVGRTIDEMSARGAKSDFVRLVLAKYMVGWGGVQVEGNADAERAQKCIGWFKDLWDRYPERPDDPSLMSVREQILHGGGAMGLPGNIELLFYFLQSLDGAELNQANEALRRRVFRAIETEIVGHKRRLAPDQETYLAEFAGRRIDTDPANFEKNTAILRVAELRVANQARCLELLKAEPVHQR